MYWLQLPTPGRLAIMPRPRGDWLADEVQGLALSGVEQFVSCLTATEVAELDLDIEQALCEAVGIAFISFPIPDRGVPPSIEQTRELIERLHTAVAEGRTVAVHCRAGIGRVSVVAACVLLRAGMNVDDAFAEIEHARGLAVPDTPQQREWVVTFAQGQFR